MDRPGSAKRRATLGDDRDLPIVYEDDALIVLDKPAGLLAVPLPLRRRDDARSVFEDLKVYLRRRGRRRPFVVHRIDRDTSGLVVFAKSGRGAGSPEGAVQAAPAGARLSGGRVRPPVAGVRAPGAIIWCGIERR